MYRSKAKDLGRKEIGMLVLELSGQEIFIGTSDFLFLTNVPF